MNIEVKLTGLERLDAMLALPVTTVSVGHEGCPHKLPSIDALTRAAERVRRAGRRFAFVAPLAYESFVAPTLATIETLRADGPVDVVVNDFGLLFGVADQSSSGDARLIAGQGLSYSFEQQPWLHTTLSQESAQIQADLIRNSLDDSAIWPVLKDAGVTGIQLGGWPGEGGAVRSLRTAGFAVTASVDHVAIAFSRSCHTARHHDARVPECTRLCDSSFQLHMTDRWRLFHNELEAMPRRLRTEVPPFTVFGNVTYRFVDTPLEWDVDGWVVDTRFYTQPELVRRIDDICHARDERLVHQE